MPKLFGRLKQIAWATGQLRHLGSRYYPKYENSNWMKMRNIYIYRKVSETSMDHPKISWNFHNSSGYSIYHHGSCPFFFAPAGCWDLWPPRPSAWPEASPTCPRAWPGVPRRSAARPGRTGHGRMAGAHGGNGTGMRQEETWWQRRKWDLHMGICWYMYIIVYIYIILYIYILYILYIIYILYNAKGLKNWFGNTRMVKSSTIWGGSEIPHSLRL